ncbi:MAG TPA: WYL domain-containing protein [Acidimicrobiia bacterium]|nr:WYL domain-containing protein [Acidimicrobiia bacterium]
MSPRAVAGSEVQRILALVPWIVSHPNTPKREIAARFGVTPEQLDDDLALVLMIGTPPYSPGDYLDVLEDDDGRVEIRLAEHFRRPLRLTPAEGLALLAAGRALLAVPGSDDHGPLATALEKLEDALDVPDLVVDVSEPELLAVVRPAADEHRRIEIDYWSAGRDELSTRRIDPETVFFAMGQWYIGAFCHRAQAERMFRVDRIRAVRSTDERFVAGATAFEPGEIYNPRPDDPRVTLRVSAEAAWIAEAYPAEAVTERDDGSLDVVLAVSEHAWLERLLVRLGTEAIVIEPKELVGLGPETARRIRARYGDVTKATSASPAPGRPDRRARTRSRG